MAIQGRLVSSCFKIIESDLSKIDPSIHIPVVITAVVFCVVARGKNNL